MRRILLFAVALLAATATDAAATDYATARRLVEENRLDEASAAFRVLAQAGDPLAQHWLGSLLDEPDGATPPEAVAWLRRAAEGGDRAAAVTLGRALSRTQPAEALAWYRRAAAQGSAEARLLVAAAELVPPVVARFTDDAVEALATAAAAGDGRAAAAACRHAALRPHLRPHCLTAALAGDAEAQVVMAESAVFPGEALEWLHRAAASGHGNARARLALAAAAGWGESRDDSAALRHAEAAASPLGHTVLGLLIGAGRGAPRDAKRSAALIQQAAEQGEPVAQTVLAYRFSHGDGVRRDIAEAATWAQLRALNPTAEPPVEMMGELWPLAPAIIRREIADLAGPAGMLDALGRATQLRKKLADQNRWPLAADSAMGF